MQCESLSQLLEVRTEASEFLGRELSDTEWEISYPQAKRKLEHIIRREGDEKGARRQPWYLGKLVEEAVQAEALTRYCETVCAIINEKAASEESGQFTAKQVYQTNTHKVNPERRSSYENTYPTT